MSNKPQNPQGTAVRVKNGRFTIHSAATGEHRTFQVKTVLADSKKGPNAFCNKLAGKRILSLLTGPDNTRNYDGFAFIDDEGVHLFASKRHGTIPLMANCFWRFATEGHMDDGSGRIYVEGLDGYMLHEGRCVLCNRALTVPESIESGIGPVCAGKE